MDDALRRVLKSQFKFQDFKSKFQKDAVLSVMSDQGKWQCQLGQSLSFESWLRTDTVVCLPTGGGKTLIYALPAAMCTSGLTVVLCPLIALMNDQKRREFEKVTLAKKSLHPCLHGLQV